ncbi:unnamed protein product [Linum trigynum]|uniref:Uncharacterized protein n=1 Tax=Linum trigynum TaxID=586398 RepID=A0AAV2E4H5_9ROSI
MERVLKPYDKEYMRLGMLKHEETFRQQVYELHRLYRIQKLMMRSSGKPIKTMPHNHHIPSNNHQEFWKTSSRINGFSFNSRNNIISAPPSNQRHRDKLAMELDLERQAEEFAESNGCRGGDHVEKQKNGTVIMEECEIELTLGPASFCPRRKKPCREEATLTSESVGGSLSSSSTESSQINRMSNKGSRVDDPENGMMMKKQSPVGISSNSNVDNINNEQWRRQQQDRRLKQQQPTWLCQVLSLNMN